MLLKTFCLVILHIAKKQTKLQNPQICPSRLKGINSWSRKDFFFFTFFQFVVETLFLLYIIKTPTNYSLLT